MLLPHKTNSSNHLIWQWLASWLQAIKIQFLCGKHLEMSSWFYLFFLGCVSLQVGNKDTILSLQLTKCNISLFYDSYIASRRSVFSSMLLLFCVFWSLFNQHHTFSILFCGRLLSPSLSYTKNSNCIFIAPYAGRLCFCWWCAVYITGYIFLLILFYVDNWLDWRRNAWINGIDLTWSISLRSCSVSHSLKVCLWTCLNILMEIREFICCCLWSLTMDGQRRT